MFRKRRKRDDQVELADGTIVTAYIADDGKVVVQIDTPMDSNVHDTARVYMNDAIANRWAEG